MLSYGSRDTRARTQTPHTTFLCPVAFSTAHRARKPSPDHDGNNKTSAYPSGLEEDFLRCVHSSPQAQSNRAKELTHCLTWNIHGLLALEPPPRPHPPPYNIVDSGRNFTGTEESSQAMVRNRLWSSSPGGCYCLPSRRLSHNLMLRASKRWAKPSRINDPSNGPIPSPSMKTGGNIKRSPFCDGDFPTR